MTHTIHVTDDLLESDEVPILRLSSDPAGDDGALTVTWRLGAGWFPVWFANIESAMGLIEESAGMQLGPIVVVPDVTYEVRLSYDYGSGTLAFVMSEVGDPNPMAQRIWTIQGSDVELHATGEDNLVSTAYHPIAATWDVVMRNEHNTVLSVRLIDRGGPMMVRTTMGAVDKGELRLNLEGDGEAMTIVLGEATRDEALYDFEVGDFPVGPAVATLEYWVDGERVWSGEPRRMTVGQVTGTVEKAQTNPSSGTFDVTVRIESDGPLQGANVYLDATPKALVWDDNARKFVESEREPHRFDLTAIEANAQGDKVVQIPIEPGVELWRVELNLATDSGMIVQFPTTTATFGAWSRDVILSQGTPVPIEASSIETRRDWEDAIAGIEERYQAFDTSDGVILFTGSSSIRIWDTLEDDFPGLPVLNAGFGGSRINEVTEYLDRLIDPVAPHTIVFYSGSNDISGGWSPERVLADYVEFVKGVHAKLPETRIIFISIAPSPGRWTQHPRVVQANRLIEMYSETDERLDYIDVYSLMLGEDGLPIPDLYRADGVHMSAPGYVIWAAAVRPYLGLE